MKPEDLYSLRAVTGVALHPDGERIAYVVSGMDRETDAATARIWVTDGARHRELTFGPKDTAPQFSPDGRWLAYLTAEPKRPAQLAVLPLDGGAPVRLTEAKDGVDSPRWLPDSSGLVYTAAARPPEQADLSDEELARRPRRVTTTQYRFNARGWTHDRRTHVFSVRLPEPGLAPAPVQLTFGDRDDTSPYPHPSGDRVAFCSSRHENAEFLGGYDVYDVPITGGEPRRLTLTDGEWEAPRWTLDGARLVVTGHPGRLEVHIATTHVVPGEGGECTRLAPEHDVAMATYLGPDPTPHFVPGGLLAPAVRRGQVDLDRIGWDGTAETVLSGRRIIAAFDATADGETVAFVAHEATRPGELFLYRDGKEERLTTITDAWCAAASLVAPSEIEVVAPDGVPIQAWVYRPPDAASTPRPALLNVHGGPLTQYGWGFFDEFQVYASAGYVVVASNPRGSDGYGEAWGTAIVADMGNLDWVDISAVADAMAALPDVDPSRLGIMGGSYGGYMTTWACGHTDRFAAAITERAVNSWESMQGTSDIGGTFGFAYLGATTLTSLDALRRQSPLTYASKIRTPMLILHSEEDFRCPIEQAEQLFVLLRMNGVEAEFVRFPGENHELSRSGAPRHRVERFEIILDWWQRRLGGSGDRRADSP